MPAKKIPNSELLASLKRRVVKPVVIVIDDLDSVRVDPAAAGSPTPSWRRGVCPETKLKTTPWREIRDKRIKPEDEPRIAKIREQMEPELRLAALRKHRKISQAAVAKKLSVSQTVPDQLRRCVLGPVCTARSG
jgi:hypothetical protein